MTPGRLQHRRIASLLVVALGCGALLLWLGAGQLHVPLTSLSQFMDWLDQTSPPVMAVALLRLLALAVCLYLVVVIGITLLLAATGRVRSANRVLRLTPVAVRRLVAGSVGAGLAVQAALGATAAGAEEASGERASEVATMILLSPAEAPPDLATMEFLEPDAPPDTGNPSPDTAGAPTPEAVPEDLPEAPSGTWVVEPGDTFWSIARTQAADTGPDEVSAYWSRLIDGNRTRLADPSNPDLLFPGQELTLPPP